MSAIPAPRQATAEQAERLRLVFFYSPLSGRCRRVEGYLAQVLQRRRNHETFEVVRVPVDSRPDLARRFRIEAIPTVLVVEGRRITCRIEQPRGCRDLEGRLQRWLR